MTVKGKGMKGREVKTERQKRSLRAVGEANRVRKWKDLETAR
jgi:hypothetical protein